MDFFEGLSRNFFSLPQACAALLAVVLSIRQLTAKSRHMNSAAFWREELKVKGNPHHTRLAREEHLKASAKVYAESTVPQLKLLGLYAVLTVIFALFFFYFVALKQVIADPQRLDAFLKITLFPILLLVASMGIVKGLQDMHLRKSNTILAITQGLPKLQGNNLPPKQGLAYLGSTSYALALIALSLNFALTSPFPLNTNIETTALEIASYISTLAFIGIGTIIAIIRKSKIQQTKTSRHMAKNHKITRPKIPWLAYSRKRTHTPKPEAGTAAYSRQKRAQQEESSLLP